MSDDETNVKMIRDEEYIQEGEVELEVTNLPEVKNAIAVINKLRRQAIKEIDVDEEQAPEGGGHRRHVRREFRIEGDKVIAHVTQGLVD